MCETNKPVDTAGLSSEKRHVGTDLYATARPYTPFRSHCEVPYQKTKRATKGHGPKTSCNHQTLGKTSLWTGPASRAKVECARSPNTQVA